LPPAAICREEAAAYVGVSPSKFDEMVKDGRMPRPKKIDTRRVWIVQRLAVALNALPDDGEPDSNPWDAATL
jgi:excisionase family DNA binding protein